MYSIKNLWNSLLYSLGKKKYMSMWAVHMDFIMPQFSEGAKFLQRHWLGSLGPSAPFSSLMLPLSTINAINTMIYVHEELHPDTVYKPSTPWKQLTSTLC